MDETAIVSNQEIAEVKKGFTKAEVNFLQLPFGSLDQHFKGNEIIYKCSIPNQNGEYIDFEWSVTANSKFGFPGPTAIELDNAISKLFQDKNRRMNDQVPKWIKVPYYELAKEMGHTINGRTYARIKKDLRRLWGVGIVSKRAFYQKGQKKWGELMFNKYQAIALKDESIPAGVPESEANEKGKAGMVYIVLGDIYWESLKNHYTKQINYDFMMSLGNATLERIYQLLSLGFQTRMTKDKEGKECLNYNYLEFCGRLPLKTWDEKFRAKFHLKRFLNKFVENKYLENYIFEFEREQERWFIRFYPGAKALEELEIISGQQTLFDHLEPQIKMIEQEKSKAKTEALLKSHQEAETKRADIATERKLEQDAEDERWMTKFSKLPAPTKLKLETEAKEIAKTKSGIVTKLSIEIELIQLLKQRLQTAKVIYNNGQSNDVQIAGEWNDWIPEAMKRSESGQWEKTLELFPGSYKYKLVESGEWKINPDGDLSNDPIGNNVISV
jgi:hypothetical protein